MTPPPARGAAGRGERCAGSAPGPDWPLVTGRPGVAGAARCSPSLPRCPCPCPCPWARAGSAGTAEPRPSCPPRAARHRRQHRVRLREGRAAGGGAAAGVTQPRRRPGFKNMRKVPPVPDRNSSALPGPPRLVAFSPFSGDAAALQDPCVGPLARGAGKVSPRHERMASGRKIVWKTTGSKRHHGESSEKSLDMSENI